MVKELVENALDAGARTVKVDIRDGGQALIQVADDGGGIAAAELETAFLRHATSKLASADDLAAIQTLGFRGEALAAIAAVSRLTAVTRTGGEEAGSRLVMEGGKKTARDAVGAPQGTVIAVENLFYNLPARRKFLKSVTTERRLIDEYVTRYALAYPQVRFRLTHDGRITFQSSGNGSLRDVLLAVYGPEMAQELLEIEAAHNARGDEGGESSAGLHSAITVAGFVGPPSLHRSNRNQIALYVNGRWIKDNSLTYAIIQAYHTMLPTGRYPLAVVFLNVPYEQVDVNVHPAKTEVRFRNGNAAFSAVQRAVRRTLIDGSPVRGLGLGAGPAANRSAYPGWGGALDQEAFARHELPAPQQNLQFSWPEQAGSAVIERAPQATPLAAADEPANLPIMRVVGQVGAAYIIAEGPDGIFLIDQHAAHERILYEQFMAARQREEIAAQGLVTGASVQLPPDQAALLEEHLELLANVGFGIEPFGPNTFMIRAVPALLARLDPAAAVRAVVEDLESGARPMADQEEARIILRVCKTAAIKAGQSLAMAEMEAMIKQLEQCHNPHTCPHGRPTLIHLSASTLAKQFGR